jgi:RNA polymerase sigma factor (sigma-70 family)
MVMGVCMRYSSREADAEDILQDSFITVFRKLDTFKATGPLGGWIRKIAVNTALMHFRKNKKNQLYADIEDTGIEIASNDDVFSAISAKELMSLIQSLPEGYRMVFNLYGIEGYKHHEIATQLSISEGTSKSQYSRARKMLINKIESEQVISNERAV